MHLLPYASNAQGDITMKHTYIQHALGLTVCGPHEQLLTIKHHRVLLHHELSITLSRKSHEMLICRELVYILSNVTVVDKMFPYFITISEHILSLKCFIIASTISSAQLILLAFLGLLFFIIYSCTSLHYSAQIHIICSNGRSPLIVLLAS